MCQSEKGDSKVLRNFTCIRCEGNIGEAVGQKEKLCDEVETVSEFIYLGERVVVVHVEDVWLM